MDHLRKALEKAESSPNSVRDWMQPVDGPRRSITAEDVTNGHIINPDDQTLASHRLVAALNDKPAIVDRYRLLRTRIQQVMKGQNWRALGITSSTPEAGKTLTTLNLGITFARADTQRVIILDADLRKPSVAAALDMNPEHGLVDYLLGNAELADIIYQPAGINNLSIIPGAGQIRAENPSELLGSARFETLIKTLRASGAIILVDTPPIQVGDDVLIIAQKLDCWLVVIEEGKTTAPELKEAARLLQDHRVIGTVMNKSSDQPKKFQTYYASAESENKSS